MELENVVLTITNTTLATGARRRRYLPRHDDITNSTISANRRRTPKAFKAAALEWRHGHSAEHDHSAEQ